MIHFTKMHGLGNDFVVIDNRSRTLDITRLSLSKLADRHHGIGFDQLLIIEPATQADFFCRIFNADGSEALQCGNGLRAIARFLHEEKIHLVTQMTIETKAGVFPITIDDYDHISVEMGRPVVQTLSVSLPPDLTKVSATFVDIGNQHIIVSVDDVERVDISIFGPALSQLSSPRRRGSMQTEKWIPACAGMTAVPAVAAEANVGFMQIINPHLIVLRTFERGVGETAACGSNACAAAVAGIFNQWLCHPVTVRCLAGLLQIGWQGEQAHITMQGPASRAFEGVIHEDLLRS